MISVEYTKLRKCELDRAPDYLPEKIKARINEIIEAINYTKTNPYVAYFSIKNPYLQRYKKVISYEPDSDEWYRYLKHLNRLQRCFCLVDTPETAEIWNIFQKHARKNSDYSIIYEWITNAFCRRINYEQEKMFFGLSETIMNSIFEHQQRRCFPKEVLEKAQEVFNIFKSDITLIAPDGADCFEYLDKNNPGDRVFLGENGNPPYRINWDVCITDDEYFEFINIFEKILEKLQNRIKLYNTRKETLTRILHNPTSRKKCIDGAQEIYFAKELYVKFMQEFNKPLYRVISLILEALFGSPYTENDIIKITKPIRNNYKELENIIKEEGYDKFFDDSYILSNIARNLKK